MILDALVGVLLGVADALLLLLPAADVAGPPVPADTAGFAQLLGTMMLLDEGLPVHETIGMMAAFVGASLVIDGFILLRSMARWLPSWITGGG